MSLHPSSYAVVSLLALLALPLACSGKVVGGAHDGGDGAEGGSTPGPDADVTADASEPPDTGTVTPPPTCSPANCPTGCCLGGVCQPGNFNSACGNGGQTCTNCADIGLPNCVGQSCETSSCNNCNGCCDFSGNCQVGSSLTACGKVGRPCQNCQAMGQTCSAMTCQ